MVNEVQQGSEPHGRMKQRTTIRDVARHAGVSPATVSNHLNGKGRLGEETRLRISQAMEALHFTPNALIRALQQRRTRVLGLLIGGIEALRQQPEGAITLPLLAGIYEAADRLEQDILLYTGWPNRPERSTGADFLDGRVDGLLWFAPNIDSPALERIAAGGLPVVALLTRRVPDRVAYVDTENVAGAHSLVSHLLAQGHRRIAFVGPTHSSNFVDRLDGYRKALSEAGVGVDAGLVETSPELRGSADAYARVLDRLLRQDAPPTAVFVCNDRWAALLADAAAARGVRIPTDLALAGYDDSPVSRTLCGGLTTVRQPFADVGRVAVESLLRLIEGADAEECSAALPVELMPRASTPPPGRGGA